MQNKKTRKLSLPKETLRSLNQLRLDQIAAGQVANNTWTYCTNCTCTSYSLNRCP
jgi:hypothetical protein